MPEPQNKRRTLVNGQYNGQQYRPPHLEIAMKLTCPPSLLLLMLCTAPHLLPAQAPTAPATPAPTAPAWAQPGSATHTQVAPPPDFHRPSKNFATPIGIFEGQSDIGGPLVPGSASYD